MNITLHDLENLDASNKVLVNDIKEQMKKYDVIYGTYIEKVIKIGPKVWVHWWSKERYYTLHNFYYFNDGELVDRYELVQPGWTADVNQMYFIPYASFGKPMVVFNNTYEDHTGDICSDIQKYQINIDDDQVFIYLSGMNGKI